MSSTSYIKLTYLPTNSLAYNHSDNSRRGSAARKVSPVRTQRPSYTTGPLPPPRPTATHPSSDPGPEVLAALTRARRADVRVLRRAAVHDPVSGRGTQVGGPHTRAHRVAARSRGGARVRRRAPGPAPVSLPGRVPPLPRPGGPRPSSAPSGPPPPSPLPSLSLHGRRQSGRSSLGVAGRAGGRGAAPRER